MRQLQDDIVERRRQSRMEQEPFIKEDESLFVGLIEAWWEQKKGKFSILGIVC